MTKNHSKLLSVIIPTYNRANFLTDAIKSINNQNYPNLEIIVVDDGSTDNTEELIQQLDDPKIKYIYQENKGPAAAKNTGLKAAKSDIIGFLDSDDLWPENKINLQLNLLLKSELEMLFGGVKHLILKNSRDKEFIEHSETYRRNSLGSALFKKSIFKKVGFFNEELTHWEDLDWILRAAEAGINVKKTKEITLIVRIHNENISRDIKRGEKFLSKVLKASIERRRSLKDGVEKLNLWSWLEANE